MTHRLHKTYFLCGMMGTGKSAIGRRFADKLKLPFHDLDVLIEAEAGMKIPEIFKTRGEPYFRKLERDILSGFAGNEPGILALGGGSLQNQNITDLVKNNGILIFIDTPLNILIKRLNKNKKRPMINELNQHELQLKVERLLEERMPYYSQAHLTIKSEEMNVEETSDKIIEKLIEYDL